MEVRVKKEECEECSRCSEFLKHLVNTNDKCAQLELDIDKKNSRIELLESTLNLVELKNLQLEDENRVLKQKNDDLERSIRNGKKEDEENSESVIEAWKANCKELELRVLELQNRVRLEKMKEGIDFSEIDSANMNESNENKDISSDAGLGSGRELKSRVRKPNNISPSTPGAMPSVDPIDFSDSDDDNLNISRTKKRRVINRVVTSDSESESESDDNVPISKLMRKNIPVINADTNPGSSSLNDSCSGEYHKKSGRKRRLIKPGREALEISKSVDEVNDENEMEGDEFDPNGIELCRKYATRYSKQLFEIYKSNEDPYFRP